MVEEVQLADRREGIGEVIALSFLTQYIQSDAELSFLRICGKI